MKKGWQTKALEDVCLFSNGLWKGEKPPFVKVGVIRNTNFTREGTLDDSDIAYIDVEAKKLEKRRLRFGDIILEKSGGGPKQPVGRVALFDKVDGDFSFSNFTAALRVRNSNELDFRFLHKYLYWTYLSGVTEGMQSHSTGIRNLDGDAYKAIKVSFPPRQEQQRIVGILDEVFDCIGTAKENVERNIEHARAVFKSHLQRLFSQRGEGWVERRLVDTCVLQRGFDLPTRSRTAGSFPLVSSSGIIDTHHEAPVKGPGVATGRSGSIGNVFYIEKDYWPLNTVLYVKEFYGNDPRFIYRLLSHFDLRRFATGAGVPTLNRNFVHDEPVWIPRSTVIQRRIAEQLDALEEETERLSTLYERKLAALESLKMSLLHEAFAGQLTANA